MTYRRDPDSTAAATTRCAQAVGEARLARLLEVVPGYLRRLANPMTDAVIDFDKAVAADIAAQAAGAGCPHYEEFSRRLAAAGALQAPRWQVLYLRLSHPLRAALATIMAACAPAPRLQPVEGRAA